MTQFAKILHDEEYGTHPRRLLFSSRSGKVVQKSFQNAVFSFEENHVIEGRNKKIKT